MDNEQAAWLKETQENGETFCSIKPTNKNPAVKFRPKGHWSESSHRKNSTNWTELHIWETLGGRYIAAEVGATNIENQKNWVEVCVGDTLDDVTSWLGYTKMSLRLFKQMGVSIVRID